MQTLLKTIIIIVLMHLFSTISSWVFYLSKLIKISLQNDLYLVGLEDLEEQGFG